MHGTAVVAAAVVRPGLSAEGKSAREGCLRGGDLRDQLSNIEIDAVLSRFLYNNNKFHLLHAVATFEEPRDEVAAKIKAAYPRTVIAPFFIRHHWALLIINTTDNSTRAFDSAPSEIMRRDMRAFCEEIGVQPPAELEGPQQFRESNECGVFTIVNAMAFVWGVTLPHRLISLRHLRDSLVNNGTIKRDEIEAIAKHFSGGAFESQEQARAFLQTHDKLQQAAALENLCHELTASLVMRALEGKDPRTLTLRELREKRAELGPARAGQEDMSETLSTHLGDLTVGRVVRKDCDLPQKFFDTILLESMEPLQQREVLAGRVWVRMMSIEHTGRLRMVNGMPQADSGHYRLVEPNVDRAIGVYVLSGFEEMTKEAVRAALADCIPGQNIEVHWLRGGNPTTWRGTLQERTDNGWNVEYDYSRTELLDTVIPRDDVHYLFVRPILTTAQLVAAAERDVGRDVTNATEAGRRQLAQRAQQQRQEPQQQPPQAEARPRVTFQTPAQEPRSRAIVEVETANPAVMRHAAIMKELRAIRGKNGFIIKLIAGEVGGEFWGVRRNMKGDVALCMERCFCESWKKIDGELHVSLRDEKIRVLSITSAERPRGICACMDEDDDDASNTRIETEWGAADEREPLGMLPPCTDKVLKGGVGATWTVYREKPESVQVLVWRALAESTRRTHITWLQRIKEMPLDLQNVELGSALVEMVLRLAKARKWAWSTVSCGFSAVQSALRSLNIYSNCAFTIDLSKNQVFSVAYHRAQKLARTAAPMNSGVKAMTVEVFTKVLKRIVDPATRLLFAVSWHFAARYGDLRPANVSQISLPKDDKAPTVIEFRHGKGGAFWGPYKIQAILPPNLVKDLRCYAEERKTHTSLWDRAHQAALAKEVAKEGLTLRSVRKGCLQYHASRNISDDDLQLLSGHQRRDTLLRYLGWGHHSSTARNAAIKRGVATVEGAGVEERRNMGPWANEYANLGRRDAKPPSYFTLHPAHSWELGIIDQEVVKSPEWGFHVKNVGTIDTVRLMELAEGTDLEERARESLRYLWDPTKYPEMPEKDPRRMPRMKFNTEQVEMMIDAGKLVPWYGVAYGHVNGWPHPEPAKCRDRPIMEPTLNDFLANLDTVRYLGRAQRRVLCCNKKYVGSLDFAAWFDQIETQEAVRKWLVGRTITTRGCNTFAAARLPMGARFSPTLAQIATWIITERASKVKGVTIDTMLDNIRVMADTPEAYLEAMKLLLEDIKYVGATLNEAETWEVSDEELIERGRLCAKDYVFLGERFRHGDDGSVTVANSDRLIEKLRKAMERFRDNTAVKTARNLAAVVGLALFMAHTLDLRLCNYFDLMQAYSRLFQTVDADKWDEPATISSQLADGLERLASILLENRELRVTEPIQPSNRNDDYDLVAVVDACKFSWAAHVWVKGGKTVEIQKHFRVTMEHSAHAEPRAISELAKILKEEYPRARKWAIITDHEPVATGQRCWYTNNGGFSSSFYLNGAFADVPDGTQFFHIDGKVNPADAPSRERFNEIMRIREKEIRLPLLSNCFHPHLVREVVSRS